ncbi:MAG: hypothetical protein BJ554DRAFT_3942, partial [Olpidium bornovanus]
GQQGGAVFRISSFLEVCVHRASPYVPPRPPRFPTTTAAHLVSVVQEPPIHHVTTVRPLACGNRSPWMCRSSLGLGRWLLALTPSPVLHPTSQLEISATTQHAAKTRGAGDQQKIKVTRNFTGTENWTERELRLPGTN